LLFSAAPPTQQGHVCGFSASQHSQDIGFDLTAGRIAATASGGAFLAWIVLVVKRLVLLPVDNCVGIQILELFYQ